MKGGGSKKKTWFLWLRQKTHRPMVLGTAVITIIAIIIIVFFIAEGFMNKRQSFAYTKTHTDSLVAQAQTEEEWFFISKGIVLESAQTDNGQQGLAVYAIINHSKAQKLGIEPGDALVQINENKVTTVEDLYQYIKDENEVVFKRNNEYYQVILK